MTSDVLVMGGGATGQLAALYLRMRFPDLKVAVAEGPHKNRPIVGESFVEITVDFLLELGLGAYLIENHFPKYGLTYYFKLEIDNPVDRTYTVDEAPAVPPLLSFQINHFTFDQEVRGRNLKNGVPLRRVIKYHVQNHFDPSLMKARTISLNSSFCWPKPPELLYEALGAKKATGLYPQ